MVSFSYFSTKKKDQQELKSIDRIPLGLWSFDNAFSGYQGEVGLPVDAFVEVSGRSGTGKSTLIYSLSGLFSQKMKNNVISMVDIEGFDPVHMTNILSKTGYTGEIKYCNGKTDESSLDNLVETMFDGSQIGFLDSIGAISPISEKEGELGEANMGRRAKLLAQFCRKSVHMMNNTKEHRIIWMNNHLNDNLGGRGSITPGGETKNYLSTIQIRLSRKEEFPDGSYILEGKATKNKYGYKNRIFHLFIMAEYGIHPGFTAIQDGIMSGRVTKDSRTHVVSIGDEKFGRMSKIKQEHRDDPSFFDPFYKVLEGVHADNPNPDDEGNSTGSGEDTELED